MKANKKIVFGIALSLFLSTTVVYAASSSDFLTKASNYISKNCDNNNISEEKSLGCYLFYKSGELDTRVTTIENNTNPPIDNDFQVNIANTSLQQGNPNEWLPRLEARPTWKGRQIDSSVELHGTWHTSSGDILFVVNGSNNYPQTFLQPIDASTPVIIPVDVTVVWQNYAKTISTTITVPN